MICNHQKDYTDGAYWQLITVQNGTFADINRCNSLSLDKTADEKVYSYSIQRCSYCGRIIVEIDGIRYDLLPVPVIEGHNK